MTKKLFGTFWVKTSILALFLIASPVYAVLDFSRMDKPQTKEEEKTKSDLIFKPEDAERLDFSWLENLKNPQTYEEKKAFVAWKIGNGNLERRVSFLLSDKSHLSLVHKNELKKHLADIKEYERIHGVPRPKSIKPKSINWYVPPTKSEILTDIVLRVVALIALLGSLYLAYKALRSSWLRVVIGKTLGRAWKAIVDYGRI